MGETTLDDVRDFTESLLDAFYDESLLEDTMARFRGLLSGDGVAFGHINGLTRASILLHGDCGEDHGRRFFDPDMENPFLEALVGRREGDPFSETTIMSEDEFQRTVFFNEWLRPQGQARMICLKVVDRGHQYVSIGMQRARNSDPFDNADKAVLGAIMPALQQYSKARLRLGAMQLRERMKGYDTLRIGFAVLTADCQILTHNEAAEAIFADPASGVKATGGRIELSEPLPRQHLKRLVSQACTTDITGFRGGDVVIHDTLTGLAELLITVMPMPDAGLYGVHATHAAGIFLQHVNQPLDQDFEQRISLIFGLTPKEAALAAALATGRTLKEAADERFISIATARTQLAQIFRKTNTDQQSQMVALLRGLPAAPRW